MTDQSPDQDPQVELLASIRDELIKANAKPSEPEAANISFDDLKTMSVEEITALDQRLLDSILKRGDQ